MTISTTASSVTLAGNGSTTVFTYSFVADSATTMEVIYTDATGVSSILSPSVYTLVINAPAAGQLWGVGGTVTYPLSGPAIATGTFLTITRIVPLTQTVTISNQGAFYPQAVEQALDLIVLELQQVESAVTTFGAGNPTATAGPTAINGIDLNYMRSDAAPAVQLGTNAQKGIVQVDGTTITASSGVISTPGGHNPTATASDTTVNGTATTFMRSDGAPAIQKASSSQFGIVEVDGTIITSTAGVITVPKATTSVFGVVEPDGTTITVSGGVISAPNAGAGNATFSTTSGNVVGDVITMRTTGTGVQDSGVLLSNLPVLLSSQTASNSTALNFTSLPTTYKRFQIVIIDLVPATNTANALIQISKNGGSTYLAGTNYGYTLNYVNTSNVNTVAGATGYSGILLSGNLYNLASFTSVVNISNPANTTYQKYFNAMSSWTDSSGGGMATGYVGGQYNTDTAAFNALRVIMSSGNITSGIVELWGYL